jgi:hypothetical protein
MSNQLSGLFQRGLVHQAISCHVGSALVLAFIDGEWEEKWLYNFIFRA